MKEKLKIDPVQIIAFIMVMLFLFSLYLMLGLEIMMYLNR